MRTFLIAAFCAALVVGATAVVIAVVVAVSGPGGTPLFSLQPGHCFALTPPDETGKQGSGDTFELQQVDRLDCDRPHTAEVLATGQLDPGQEREYPDDASLFAEVDERCGRFEAPADELGFGVLSIVPNEEVWEPRGGPYLCLAVPYGLNPVTGSIRPTLVEGG